MTPDGKFTATVEDTTFAEESLYGIKWQIDHALNSPHGRIPALYIQLGAYHGQGYKRVVITHINERQQMVDDDLGQHSVLHLEHPALEAELVAATEAVEAARTAVRRAEDARDRIVLRFPRITTDEACAQLQAQNNPPA